jgi:hypothetical protein
MILLLVSSSSSSINISPSVSESSMISISSITSTNIYLYLVAYLLNCIKSRIVDSLSWFCCLVITRLEILNSRSILTLLTRTAKILRAIFESFEKIDWDFLYHDRGFLTDLSRLLDKYIINLLTSSLLDDESNSKIDR